MADEDRLIAEVYRKIDRERALISAASNMRQSTNNPTVQARVDSNIRDGRKNISYLEEKLRELQLRKAGRSEDGGPNPPQHGMHLSPGQRGRGMGPGNGPTPPPKDGSGYYPDRDDRGGYGDPGPGGYSATGAMPPRAPYNDPRPFIPKARPNFSKLGASHSRLLLVRPTANLMSCSRSYQIRHSLSRTQNSAHAFTTRVQVECGETIQSRH